MTRRAGLWLALAGLAACSTPPPAMPSDATLARLGHAGDIAFALENPAQAADQYRATLGRARERDDAGAIADAGFNLAAAELRADHPAAALQTSREVQAELARRGSDDPGFTLIIATALFRTGDAAGADRLAARLADRRTTGLADQAWFLRGLIADARGDGAALRTAAGSLSPTADPADRSELQARIARDAAAALRTADLRREALDYRGMARALGLAGQFTADAGQSSDYYLRAGQSAAARHDVLSARIWLAQAQARATDAATREQAGRALADLSKNGK